MASPFIYQKVEDLRAYCGEKGVEASFVLVDSLEQAKGLPCAFNNWAVFYKGNLQTVNLLDAAAVERILKK